MVQLSLFLEKKKNSLRKLKIDWKKSVQTYYANVNKTDNSNNISNNPNGRPIPGYSYTIDGRKINDKLIKEWLLDLIDGNGFPYNSQA